MRQRLPRATSHASTMCSSSAQHDVELVAVGVQWLQGLGFYIWHVWRPVDSLPLSDVSTEDGAHMHAAGPGTVSGGVSAAAPLADGLVAHHPCAALDLALSQLPHRPAGLQGGRISPVQST
jgi:hypothetical protein